MSTTTETESGYAVIERQINRSKIKPNMTDYDAMCQSFNWDTVEKELNLPRANGVNQATICIDGHPEAVMNKTALLWKGAQGEKETYTFNDLKNETNKFANVLTDLGVNKGDRVFVYLERIPETFITLFGALKTGSVVGPLFSAFGPEAIKDRLEDSNARFVVTSPDLIERLNQVLPDLPNIEKVILVDKRGVYQKELKPNEISYEKAMAEASTDFSVVETSPDDYSIIHYTSGTTGKPKGAVHRHQAVVAQYATAKDILDFQPDDIYWCTADPGWVTGTSYGMFGPWSNGITQVVYEGGFSAETWYDIIDEYNVTIWYTAPTAIRMLMKADDEVVKNANLSSLRHLCSVGEPLNPEAIVWGQEVYGHVFHDTWWQTETGSMHICNYPCLDVKPGSMGRPFPGITAGIIDENGEELPRGEEGHLALRPTSPSFFRMYWQREEMFNSRFRNDWYLTGDRAKQDKDGYFWFIGRADDVINTAGHLVGPFEVESALIEHPAVAEAAVIGKPDPERLEIIKAFVSLKEGYEKSDEMIQDIKTFVRNKLAAHAYPREIDILDSLPKTRSGKIMRRLLKARELGLPEGDTSTLEE